MAEYESLRQRHLADLAALLPEHTQRLHWAAERLGGSGGTACVTCCGSPGRLRPGTGTGWPGSTPTASRRPTWRASPR